MKRYLTREEYERKLRLIKRENKSKQYNQLLKDAKSEWKTKNKIRKPKETSKKLAIYLFVLMNVIIVYCLVAMWYFGDLSYLGVLITDIAAQILIYGIYCLKAYKAKKSSEDMKYKRETNSGLNELLAVASQAEEHVPVNGDVTLFKSDDSDINGFNSMDGLDV